MNLTMVFFFLGASIGHIAILAYSLNWWYGLPLPHKFLSSIKLLHGALVVLGLLAFAYAGIFPISFEGWINSYRTDTLPVSFYAVACVLVGWIVVPVVTLKRFLRTKPAVLASNHTDTVDLT